MFPDHIKSLAIFILQRNKQLILNNKLIRMEQFVVFLQWRGHEFDSRPTHCRLRFWTSISCMCVSVGNVKIACNRSISGNNELVLRLWSGLDFVFKWCSFLQGKPLMLRSTHDHDRQFINISRSLSVAGDYCICLSHVYHCHQTV